jgi:hypothetical protein
VGLRKLSSVCWVAVEAIGVGKVEADGQEIEVLEATGEYILPFSLVSGP